MARLKYNLGFILAALVIIAGCLYIYFEHYAPFKAASVIEVSVWLADDNVIGRNLNDLAEKYNSEETEKNGIKISIKSFKTRAELYDTISQCVDKDTGLPDVIICDTDYAAYLNNKGKLADMDKYFSEWEKSTFNDSMVEASTDGGDFLAVPIGAETGVFIVNNSLFNEFDSITSFEKLCSVAGEYYGRNNKPFFSLGDYSMFFRTAMSQLGDSFDASNPRNNDNDNNKYIYNTLADAAYSRGFADVDNPAELVIKGELPCAIVTSAQVMAFSDDDIGDDIDIKSMPLMKNGKSIYFERVIGATITSNDSAEEKAAAEFIEWLSEQDNIQYLTEESGHVPSIGSLKKSSGNKLFEDLCNEINAAKKSAKEVFFKPDGDYSLNSIRFDKVLKTIMGSLN